MAKLMIVEDEDELRDVIVDELTDEGHIVVNFPRGQKALDYLAEDTVDLIISDITMPEMNGYQFFRTLRETFPQHVQTPFIFMTALADRDSEVKGLRLGVDDYITKPIDFDVMFLRVEAHLRRRLTAAAAASTVAAGPAPQPTTPSGENGVVADGFQGDPEAKAKLCAILKENGGRLMASRFVTISLEKVRERVGDNWLETSQQILQQVELVIRAYLGPNDSFCIKPSQDFLVCFADTDEGQLAFKTSLIRDAIWEKLFSLTKDEDLATIDATTYDLSISSGEINEKSIFSDIGNLLDEKGQRDKDVEGRQLEQIHKYDEIHAVTLIGLNGSPSKIKSLSFNKKAVDKARTLFKTFEHDGEFLLDIQKTFFQRLQEKPNLKKAHAKHALLLPVQFSLLRDPKTRDGLTALCRELERDLEVVLIIEVTDAPDRLKSYKKTLEPLPIGRKLQFIELRRPQQAEDIALDELGVACISMSFNHVEANQANGIADFRNRLEGQGVKLYIKDIPEGRLLDAQRYKGSLLSMQQ